MSDRIRGLRFALARVTIELQTPLTIGTGAGDDTRDALCVEDANGLPTLPATSLAGVLRHALARGGDPETDTRCRELFGYQVRNTGASSRVEISWAQTHDSQDCPVRVRGADLDDEVLRFLEEGVLRDHVRIGLRGVVDGAGKFDETLVPAGARFTFEILVHASKKGDDPTAELSELLGLFASPGMRIGGRTRRGFGAFKVARVLARAFDLTRRADQDAWLALPRALEVPVPAGVLMPVSTPAGSASSTVRATLHLNAQDHWIFGGGRSDPQREEHLRMDRGKRTDRAHDRLPVTEQRIRWTRDGDTERGAVEAIAPHLIPASSIKGALRHRVAFHARRYAGAWARETGEAWGDLTGAYPPTVEELWLFGACKGRAEGEGDEDSSPGRVYLSDLYQEEVRYGAMEHVSLDRFTQGPMDGLLFSEAPLFRGPALVVHLDLEVGGDPPASEARKALAAALDDLCRGRLALGAGGSKGHGYFDGHVAWSDGRRWIEGRS